METGAYLPDVSSPKSGNDQRKHKVYQPDMQVDKGWSTTRCSTSYEGDAPMYIGIDSGFYTLISCTTHLCHIVNCSTRSNSY